MTLTTRNKWLLVAAALVAGYVAFGSGSPDAVEPTRSARGVDPTAEPGAAPAHPGKTAAPTMPIAHALLALAHRVVPGASGSLFAAHSWYVAPPPPPPPPPPPVDTASLAPPVPTAPPLPYQYIGSYTPDGQQPVFFLSKGDRVFDVHVGDTLEGTYTVDGFDKSRILLTYKPLKIQQQLMVGSTQ